MVKMFLAAAMVLLLPLSVQAHGKSGHDNKYERCKPFNKKVRIDGKRQRLKGYSCRQHDGSWEFVSRDEYHNREHYDDHYDDEHSSRRDPVFRPSFGISIGSGGHYGYGHRRKRGHYGYSSHRWRGGDFLRSMRYKHKRKWKKRGGNSYSHLIRKSPKNKK